MKKNIILLMLICSCLYCLYGCKSKQEFTPKYLPDETIKPIQILQDEKYPEIYYLYYDDNLKVEYYSDTGSRNIIKNDEYILGIASDNTKSNEDIFKEIR